MLADMEELSEPPSPPQSPKPDLISRFGKILEIILAGIASSLVVPILFAVCGIGGLAILESAWYLVPFLLIEATLTLLIIWGILRLNGETFKDLAWSWVLWKQEALIGLAFLPLLFVTTFVVGLSFRLFFPTYVTEINPLLNLIQTRSELLLFLISSVLVGGFKEEIQRAFVLVRFGSHLGGMRIGLILWGLFFAYGHMMQGVDNAAGAGALGLIFGILYMWRRNLVAPIVAHAAYDVTTLIIYWSFLRSF